MMMWDETYVIECHKCGDPMSIEEIETSIQIDSSYGIYVKYLCKKCIRKQKLKIILNDENTVT